METERLSLAGKEGEMQMVPVMFVLFLGVGRWEIMPGFTVE